MTLEQKIEEAKKQRIYLPDNLLKKDIVGVYGFFAAKENVKECFYIGKATNMIARLLDSSEGHVHHYLYKHFGNLVPDKIKEKLDLGYDIKVEILDEIDYEDTFFSRAAHRLALAEIQQIVKYQELGQCLEQSLEGVGKNEEEYWKRRYRKNT